MIALRVASPTELAAALMMLSAYSHQIVSSCVQVSTASNRIETKVKTAATRPTMRRSKASASIPPYRPARIIGTRPATATIETAKVLAVSSNT